MPPRPFPFPLRVGTDICHIPRIHGIVTRALKLDNGKGRPRLDRFTNKFLTWPEQHYFRDRFPDHDNAYEDGGTVWKMSRFLAGRWAAKEACRKACNHLGSSNGFKHIVILPVSLDDRAPDEITTRPRGLILRQGLQLPNHSSEPWKHWDIEDAGGQYCEISISHDGDYATAIALVPSIDHLG